ncbi:nucleoside-diphosphate sugar epimerase/dehydratase [Blastococcus sp. Marseille-P5729]|uniref:nucleoside-diphosphate sugar epimerase/dehydratase n=1 Tax=Blastococcus sp. Marseille-P5729 TaxID=2086582 RepID=UPI0018FE6318|nr:nucleoside-diphosphate sugar epimerase/dehydratase [Blastococcus sp. Marseille-P5729]
MVPGNISTILRRNRVVTLVVFDAVMWLAASGIAALVRLELNPEAISWRRVGFIALLLIAIYLLVGRFVRLHQGRATLATVDETVLLSGVALISGAVVFFANFFWQLIPRSVPILTTLLALVLMILGRSTYRAMTFTDDLRAASQRDTRVVVIGAGNAGRQVIGSMLRTPTSPWLPVALLDDDKAKRHLKISGVPVKGRIDDLVEVADEVDARMVIVAVPSADRELFQRVSAIAQPAGLDVKVLPSVNELFRGQVGIRDLRDINVDDVLGRKQIDTDLRSIADYIDGKRVLVTGAGGSIGSELCRQISAFSPAQLLMLDRDESALHSVQLSIYGHGMLDSPDMLLCDIREADVLDAIFDDRRPEVVFHAAALKHLPMLEQYPAEGVKTNILGTLNVLNAANRVGVERFVNISTDKAANPESVLGYTKRIAEGLTAHMAGVADGTYISVRFGNVLGSRGSVLETFARQIAEGGPVTVTHPDVTRYFMTIPEAVQLVIQAAAVGSEGEALVLDMGDPIRIDYVARQLIALSGEPIEIKYTGLRGGEKLHEDLVGLQETVRRDRHPLISHVEVPFVDPQVASWILAERPNDLSLSLQSVCEQMTRDRGESARV